MSHTLIGILRIIHKRGDKKLLSKEPILNSFDFNSAPGIREEHGTVLDTFRKSSIDSRNAQNIERLYWKQEAAVWIDEWLTEIGQWINVTKTTFGIKPLYVP